MILYFTGTGNSKYVADMLADKLEDEIISMNEIIKNQYSKVFDSTKPYVIVAPIYAWRLPLIIEDFIIEAKFNGNKDIYVVATMESQTGNADKYCEKLFKQTDMHFKGLRGVCMPSNYGKIPSQDKIDLIIKRAKPEVLDIVRLINSHQSIHKTDNTPFASIASKAVNDLFYKFYVSDSGYNVNDDCIECGLCKKLCPVNNIQIVDHKPAFQGNCIGCLSCLHHCPKQAINIKKRTLKTGRYVCPSYQKGE